MWPRKGEVRALFDGGFYRMAYVEMGNPAATPVVCVHGLTRNGRDFDPLMEALAERFLVIAPDLPGRGRSEWLPRGELYQPPVYVLALAHLLAAIGRPVMWVGTSLGGICGMMVAAATGQPIIRMVLNDIGPHIPSVALARIRDYMTTVPESFPDMAALEAYLRRVHAPFGALSDAEWAHMARFSGRLLADGRLALHYDPKIAEPIRAQTPADVDLWALWERIRVPVLAVRGEQSDLLLPETLRRMVDSGAKSLTVPGAGHAPALSDAASIAAIGAFLAEEPA
jgi:pimeloyl-ACP methyl ester carboxylesterase